MAEIDLAKGIRLLAEAFNVMGREIAQNLTQNDFTQNVTSLGEYQLSLPDEINAGITLNFEYDIQNEYEKLIVQAIGNIIQPTAIIDILHEKQMLGFGLEGQKIGKYEPTSWIEDYEVEQRGLKPFPPKKDGTPRHKMKYAVYKNKVYNSKPPFGWVDLNLSGYLYQNYDYININLKTETLLVAAMHVPYYEDLVALYGYAGFMLSFEEVGLTPNAIENEIYKILKKELGVE